MNKFEKQLEKWNNGVLRGAQAKLAKTLGVSTATTALWATGKRRPSKGYVAQMAQLFGLDSFDVFKLFDYRSTTYPEPRAVPSVHALRDQDNGGCSYLAGEGFLHESDAFPEQSNSVQLPFLNSVPAHYPNYEESDIIEWWSVPRRFAQGAKYILRTADTGWDKHADKDDLCLVKPGQELAEGKIVLLEVQAGRYVTRRVQKEGAQTLFLSADGKKKETAPQGRILGMLVKRISNV